MKVSENTRLKSEKNLWEELEVKWQKIQVLNEDHFRSLKHQQEVCYLSPTLTFPGHLWGWPSVPVQTEVAYPSIPVSSGEGVDMPYTST